MSQSPKPMKIWLARALVDRQFYLSRYQDVALAGVDPVAHFAEHGFRTPMRSPSQRFEKLLLAGSGLLVTVALLFGVVRSDFLDLLREQIIILQGRGRRLRPFLYLFVFRLYATLQASEVGQPMKIARIYADAPYAGARRIIAPEGDFAFTDPEVILSGKPARNRQVKRPSLWCATLEQAQLFGSLQIAVDDAFLVSEPAADPRLSFVAGQHEFVTAHPLNRIRSTETIFARRPATAEATVPEAVLLGGRCGVNYFHFLIEYVTKGYIVERIAELDGLPLIVPDDLYPQELELLEIVFPGRALVRHRRGTRIDVAKLHVPSTMTYVPDCPKTPFWQVSAVNHDSLAWLRDRVLAAIAIPAGTPRNRKIFLARFQGRNIENAEAVTEIFRASGFEIVDTAKMTFADQVVTFATASHIAGPVGAAFSNLIFCAPEAKILGIVSPFAVQMSLFKSLSDFAGARYYALPGTHPQFRTGMDVRRPPLHVSHGSFSVDPAYLSDALKVFREA
ncbi:glycosyltransferase family 61 protein [Methylobacterium radiotolerans]|uniref:glycosyltransferase family 61 protein n=1 Tax=Methylobacterium radiotolerans TaxID=31998 RepID=UPI0015F6938D|nr:glycosyltransferase family 61 protein [Methylobacterium radiotolerans]